MAAAARPHDMIVCAISMRGACGVGTVSTGCGTFRLIAPGTVLRCTGIKKVYELLCLFNFFGSVVFQNACVTSLYPHLGSFLFLKHVPPSAACCRRLAQADSNSCDTESWFSMLGL